MTFEQTAPNGQLLRHERSQPIRKEAMREEVLSSESLREKAAS